MWWSHRSRYSACIGFRRLLFDFFQGSKARHWAEMSILYIEFITAYIQYSMLCFIIVYTLLVKNTFPSGHYINSPSSPTAPHYLLHSHILGPTLIWKNDCPKEEDRGLVRPQRVAVDEEGGGTTGEGTEPFQFHPARPPGPILSPLEAPGLLPSCHLPVLRPCPRAPPRGLLERKCPYHLTFPSWQGGMRPLWGDHLLAAPHQSWRRRGKWEKENQHGRQFKIKPVHTEMATACKAHFQPCRGHLCRWEDSVFEGLHQHEAGHEGQAFCSAGAACCSRVYAMVLWNHQKEAAKGRFSPNCCQHLKRPAVAAEMGFFVWNGWKHCRGTKSLVDQLSEREWRKVLRGRWRTLLLQSMTIAKTWMVWMTLMRWLPDHSVLHKTRKCYKT